MLEIFSVAVTSGIYFVAQFLYRRYHRVWFNPLMLTIAGIIILLRLLHIEYEAYMQGGNYINFLLKPAIVALGVPLYEHLKEIKKQSFAIILSQLAGCIAGMLFVIGIAYFFNASHEVILSLIPKSVTTPVAIEISQAIGGIPPFTAGVVVTVGILGAVAGPRFLKIIHVTDREAAGLALGSAAHGLGTAKAAETGRIEAAYSSLGMILTATVTALLTPWIVRLMNICLF
jgi:predicted murein hydrolase (TIGR00659 family)